MRPPPSFPLLLGGVCAGALGIRIWAALTLDHPVVQGDAMTFHQVARHLADGDGFRAAFEDVPTAEHPPGWELVLAAADVVGGNGFTSHRLLGALIGTLIVAGVGLLGRRVGGDTVGVVAAVLAAVNPMLWGADVSLMSEPLYGLLLVAALLVATRVRERPAAGPVVALGVLLGLAALTRGEAVGFLVLLVVPLLWPRWRLMLVATAACTLTIAPWTIRNATTFDAPVVISTNANTVWIGANCPETYYGDLKGYWSFRCFKPVRPGEDEAEWSVRQREDGLNYMREHDSRLPAVVPARLARTFELWDFGQSLYLNAQEGRAVKPLRWGIRFTWVLLALAAIGGVVLWRRRSRYLVVVLAPVVLVIVLSVLVYGMTRFRYAAEPSLCVLAALTLTSAPAALRALRTRRRTSVASSP